MREGTIINEFGAMRNALRALAEGVKVSVVAQSIRDQALENLLVSKGLITREELAEAVKKETQSLMEQATAAAQAQATPTIVTPDTSIVVPEVAPQSISPIIKP